MSLKLNARTWFFVIRAISSASSRNLTKRPIIPDKISRGGEVITFQALVNAFANHCCSLRWWAHFYTCF